MISELEAARAEGRADEYRRRCVPLALVFAQEHGAGREASGAVRITGLCLHSWLRMAEIYDELGNKRRASALRKKAAALFKKFNEDFWDEESGFYAYALDGEKKKVLSGASNVGQCLWSGIVAPERLGHPHTVGGPSLVQSVQVVVFGERHLRHILLSLIWSITTAPGHIYL